MAATLEVPSELLWAVIEKRAEAIDEPEATSEIAAANPIMIGPGADTDVMLEQRGDALGETHVNWFDVRHAEAVAAAILAHAKVIREQR